MNELNNEIEDDQFMLEIARLQFQIPMAGADYYCITLLGNEDGTIEKSIISHWAGFTDTKPQREIRVASIIDPQSCREAFRMLKEPSSIVSNTKDLYIYFVMGGHGIIEKSLAEKFFPDLIKPEVVVQSFSKGFLQEKSLPKQKIIHAPTKKVRMNVIKRDNFRCRICGRSPDDYVDIELHVHHILPWGQGGMTEEDNLITLCSTCHDGLEPHFEPRLFGKLGISHLQHAIGSKNKYPNGLKLYMDIISKNHFENR